MQTQMPQLFRPAVIGLSACVMIAAAEPATAQQGASPAAAMVPLRAPAAAP